MKFGDIEARIIAEFKQYPKLLGVELYWHSLKTLKNYLIVIVIFNVFDGYNQPHFLALHTSDKVLHLEGIADLGELLAEENIEIREQNVAEIMDIISIFKPEQEIVTNIQEIIEPELIVSFSPRKNKMDKIQSYADIIRPPVFELKDVPTITFWRINLKNNDLEQWEISERVDAPPKVEWKTLETNIIYTTPLY